MASSSLRTLRRSVRILGGDEAVAEALGVSLREVQDWLAEKGRPLGDVYLAALDIIAYEPNRILQLIHPRRSSAIGDSTS